MCAAGDIEGEVDRLKRNELNNLGARKRLAYTEDADDRGRTKTGLLVPIG